MTQHFRPHTSTHTSSHLLHRGGDWYRFSFYSLSSTLHYCIIVNTVDSDESGTGGHIRIGGDERRTHSIPEEYYALQNEWGDPYPVGAELACRLYAVLEARGYAEWMRPLRNAER